MSDRDDSPDTVDGLQGEREFHEQLVPVAMDGRDPPRVGGPVVGGEEGPQALIVPFAISCRDEHVRRLPDRLGPGPPEQTLRPGVPIRDHAGAVLLDARREVRSNHDDR